LTTGLVEQQKIFASHPEDRRAFEALEENFFLEGDWEALVRVYQDRLAAPSIAADPSQCAPLLFRLGQILEERILDLEAASETYWTLARMEPTNRPALRQLRGIHERGFKWDMVLQIAELESATEMPPYERAAFETELGQTWKEHLGDAQEAQNAFERALAADPEFPAALDGLAKLHQEAGRLEEAAAILERLTRRLRGPERAPAWVSLGRLYTLSLGEPARARACFEAALEDDPFQIAAVEWSLLLATTAEDWEAVSELLERRFDLAAGARQRAAVAIEASQIQLHHRGSSAGARAWTDRAVELASHEISVLLAVADVERSDGAREELLAALDQVITIAGLKAPRSVLVEAAELHAEIGNPDAALDAIRRASQIRGAQDQRVLTLHADLLRRGGSKRELAEVLETLTGLPGSERDTACSDRLCELARLQEEDLGEEATAATTWRRAFDLDPKSDLARNALERIHRKTEDWTALRGTLETALNAQGATPAPSLSATLGSLLLEHFDEKRAARTLFDAALEAQPDCRPALVGLRRIAELEEDPDLLLEVCNREAEVITDADAMAELARTAIPILNDRGRVEEALAWAERWTERAPDALEAFETRAGFEAELARPEAEVESRRQLAKLQHGCERSRTLRRQAELHLALEDDPSASATLELALAEEPGERETLEALCSVYRRLDRATDLVRTLRQWIEQLPTSERAEPMEELASNLHDPIGDLDAAIVVRWQLCDLHDAPEDAHAKLETLLESAGRYAELAQLLDTLRQRLGDDAPEAFALDLRRGRVLLDSLGQCEEAARIFSALHERHPDNDEILDQLERALRVGDDSRGLVDLLERRAGWESNDERKAAIQLERASLLEEALGETAAACDLYEEISQQHPDSAAATAALDRMESLLESSGQWSRLRAFLTTRIDTLPVEALATQRERIAAICRDRLQDIAGCAEQLEAIAEIVTDRVHVWQQLGEIYSHELDRPADWLRVVEQELDADPAPDREFALRVGAARLCLDEARRPAGHDEAEAYVHYERVFEIEPTHAEAAEVLAVHFTSLGRPADTARILELRLSNLAESTGTEVNDLRLRLARVYAEALEQDDRARPFLEAARAELGAAPQVADPLAELYERTKAFDALSRLCREAIAERSDDCERLVWRMRLAESDLRAGRLEDAAIAYRAVLVERPDDREIEGRLIEIYEQTNETEPLTDLLEKRLAYADQEELIDLHLRLARLHTDARDEPAEALAHLEWILASHPHHRFAFDRAIELAERLEDPDRVLSLLDRVLDTPMPTVERAAFLERRGELLAAHLDRPEQAVVNFRETIALDRQNRTAHRKLREQLERLGRWPAVLDCLFVEASEADPEHRIELYEEAVEIANSHINPDASLPWIARLRAERPEDPELFARLAEVHRRAGRFEAALHAFDDELALRSDPAARCRLHIERAHILERELHAPGRAILAYHDALTLTDDPSEILEELDRLYDTMGRPLERAEILEIRVANLDAIEGLDLRQTLASLYCADLAKPELALPHLQTNVDATRGEPREEMIHLGALDAALRASARRDAWVQTAERELELIAAIPEIRESTPPQFIRFLRQELARTYDSELGDPDRAITHLRALCANPDNEERQSSQQLRGLLRRTGRLPELAERLTEHLASGDGTAAEWLELARLREENLLDLPGAREAYQKAETDPDRLLEAIRGRRRCSERLRDWRGMADALEAEYGLETVLDRNQRIAIARKLADVCWQRLGEGDRAAAGYQLALDLDPRNLAALRSLILVQEARAEVIDLVALYRRELELLRDTDEDRSRSFEIWLRLATLLRETGDEPNEAIEAYQSAARLERLSAPDELQLARLHERGGDMTAFLATQASWCDREDSGASVIEHLELARRLMDNDEGRAARKRAVRATEVAPNHPEAWALLAELHREADALDEAADAFERAADHATASDAASHLVSAAGCLEDRDSERAQTLLIQATELDPSHLAVHIALTRIANANDDFERTASEAEIALGLGRTQDLDRERVLELSLLGGRAARQHGDHNASRRLFESALEIDPDQLEALDGLAAAHFEDKDFRAARAALEHRFELDGEDPERGRHLAMIARDLEAEDHFDLAWTRYEEAIETEPTLDDAHEGLVRVHERSSRPELALDALERWSEATEDREIRARATLRAAEHALALEDADRARRNLETSTSAAPRQPEAWVALCEIVGRQGPDGDTRRVCREALAALEPDDHAARIALQAARLAESVGDREEAIRHYANAAQWDPRCGEAALSESRLIRTDGDWARADEVLARFIEAHPDSDSPALAHLHLDRGRLLAGPLEECDQAIVAYERALALQPDLGVARTALAGLLLHAPDRWRDALTLHEQILAGAPTTAHSLRAIVQLADGQHQTDVAQGALAILRALGQASPQEAAIAGTSLPFPIRPGPPMANSEAERLRRIAHQLRAELDEVLVDVDRTPPSHAEPEIQDALQQILAIEDEISAPGINRLAPTERASLFSAVVALFLDPGGNSEETRYSAALDRTLGRWTRRKVRRIVEEIDAASIESLDHEAWGFELRAMAAAQAIDRDGGDLRSVLRALLSLESEAAAQPILEGANIGTLASTSETARRLLARITTLLCERLERGR
jgi:tetratricopeptide (TPR) repeat protein